jgi:hypothetical protein
MDEEDPGLAGRGLVDGLNQLGISAPVDSRPTYFRTTVIPCCSATGKPP